MGWQGRKFFAGFCLALCLMRGMFNLAADVDLLLGFKRTVVTRDPLSVLTSWAPSNRRNYCAWYGITCGRDASITWVDSISITSCQLEFTMWDGFASFPRLRYINFSDNSISGSIPPQLGSLKSLVSLDLSSNHLFGSVPSTFSDLSSLETLVLGSNNIAGAVPNSLCRSASLRILDMSFNKLTGLTNGLKDCKKLEVLNLEHNEIESDISQIPFSQLKSLRALNIGSNHIKGPLTKELAKSSTITVMQFQNNAISGSIPGALGLLTMLTVLDLSSNQLRDIIPETIGNLALLEDLSLSQNMFSGVIPSSLGTLTGLSKRLDLSQNKFTGAVPMALGSMKWVKFIDLSDNMLSGSLPPSLGGCESLISLDLSGNDLSGSIPSTWINMASLLALDLSHNDLSGNIPAELGQLASLSTLDLSWNSLTGNIPNTLADLGNLQSLNLSSNFLSGEIPETPLFQSLGKSSFLNNSNLCGTVLKISCSADSEKQHRTRNMDLKTLLGQAGRVLNFVGFALLATVLLFVFTLVLFKCFFAENYEATVDCLESRCSILVACISCLHLATWHPRIDVETLKYATESFKEENIIGQGKRSTVYKGYLAESFLSCGEKIVAVKRIERNSNEVKNIMKECRVLRQMNNQNVVKVLDWRQTGEEIFIVMDFFVNGDLETYLYTADTVIGLEMLLCLQIAIDVAKGIACLHNEWWNERIVHCNLHCSHVLLDQNLNAHISGLRYMKRSNLEKFQFEETEGGSIAPECLTGHLLCKEAEVYSYGIFLLELITRKKPMGSGLAMDKNLCAWVQERFPAKGIEVANAHLLSTTYNPENLLSFIYLALSCVEQSQDTRPNMNKVVITLQQLKNAEMEAMSIQSAYGNNSIQETN